MKKLLPIIILFILTSCNDTDTTDNTSKKVFFENLRVDTTDLTNKFDVSILLGCGAAGTVSKQLDSTRILVFRKDYKTIISNLNSPDLLTQISSVVALETLNKKKLINLSIDEQKQINQIKTSKKTCSVCQGCTGHYSGIIADIFEPKDTNNIILDIKYKLGLGDNQQM